MSDLANIATAKNNVTHIHSHRKEAAVLDTETDAIQLAIKHGMLSDLNEEYLSYADRQKIFYLIVISGRIPSPNLINQMLNNLPLTERTQLQKAIYALTQASNKLNLATQKMAEIGLDDSKLQHAGSLMTGHCPMDIRLDQGPKPIAIALINMLNSTLQELQHFSHTLIQNVGTTPHERSATSEFKTAVKEFVEATASIISVIKQLQPRL